MNLTFRENIMASYNSLYLLHKGISVSFPGSYVRNAVMFLKTITYLMYVQGGISLCPSLPGESQFKRELQGVRFNMQVFFGS